MLITSWRPRTLWVRESTGASRPPIRLARHRLFDWGLYPVLIGERLVERIRNESAEGLRGIRWLTADEKWPIFVFDATDSAERRAPPPADVKAARVDVSVVLARCEPPSDAPANRAELSAVFGLDVDELSGLGAVVVIAVGKDCIVPYHSPDNDSVFPRKLIVLPDQSGLRSGRTAAAIGKSVAIVGLGSIGSKIAETLLRSGVERFVLVDGDVFLPYNLERHTLDWLDVGSRKSHAVKHRLLQIAPGASIQVIAENLDWQRSAKRHAQQIEAIAACHLIVDATGDAPTTLMLGALAWENSRPMISAEVFEGGLGVLLARSIPGRDPPYAFGRSAYLAYCEQMKGPRRRPPDAGSTKR